MSKIKPSYCDPYGLKFKKGRVCDISDATLPFPDMLPFLTESENVTVETHSGQSKKSVSRYDVDIINKYVGSLAYAWTVSGGVIVGPHDSASSFIYVETDSVDTTNFTVTCVVSSGYRSESVSDDYTHIRVVGDAFIVLNGITEIESGSCTFDTKDTCTAISKYRVEHVGGEEFDWSTSAGIIIPGESDDIIFVQTTDDEDISIVVSCKVSNNISEDTINDTFVHDRTENVILPVIINSLTETLSGSCLYGLNQECIATSEYLVDASNYDNIYWAAQGDVTIVSGQHTDTLVVQSSDNIDSTFDITANVSNDAFAESIKGTYTHTRAYDVPAEVTSIETLYNNSCTFDSGDGDTGCLAESSYLAHVNKPVLSYKWIIEDGNFHIVGSDDSDTVVIRSSASSNHVGTLSCETENDIGGVAKKSIEITHVHSDLNLPLSITSISEQVAGSCEYPIGEDCVASGQYKVFHEGRANDIIWACDDGTIVAGQSTDVVTIESTGNTDSNIEVAVYISNAVESDSDSAVFVHDREEMEDPVAIVSLTEDTSGNCEFNVGSTCVANSSYTVVATDYDTLVWSVVGGVIDSGQGTASVSVSSDSDVDSNVTVSCVANGLLGGSDSISGVFIHTRTEITDVFDKHVTYDVNNIAEEFTEC